MNTLQEDRDAVHAVQGWVQRQRAAALINPNECALWLVNIEQGDDTHTLEFFRSPGDALAWATCYAADRDARRDSTGRWTLEVFGYDGILPRMLVVRPTRDEEGRTQ